MNYPVLSKLFYKNRELYKQTYQDRFHAPDTLHLDFQIHENQAFIVSTAEMWGLLYDIQKVNTDIRVLCSSNQLPDIALDQFVRRCLIDEIILTNDIEGVNSTRREVREILFQLDHSDSKTQKRFWGLILKYRQLQLDIPVALKSCGDIRALYDDLVLPEVLEEEPANTPDGVLFRKESVSVETPAQKEIHHGLTPESRIISAMENALRFLNDDGINPLIRVSAFHYLFGYIHPFYDGNGRTSRFISSYLLSKELNPLIGYRLSYTVKENIKSYYDAFKLCNDKKNKGDLTPFVILFLEIVLKALRQLEQALTDRRQKLTHGISALHGDPFLCDPKMYDISFLLLQASLFSDNGISTQELMEYAAISYSTLNKRLSELSGRNLLLSNKLGKEKFYQLNVDSLPGYGSP